MAKKKNKITAPPPDDESHYFRAGDPVWLDVGDKYSDGMPMPMAVWVVSTNNAKGTALVGYYEPQGTRNEKQSVVSQDRLRHREVY